MLISNLTFFSSVIVPNPVCTIELFVVDSVSLTDSLLVIEMAFCSDYVEFYDHLLLLHYVMNVQIDMRIEYVNYCITF